MTAEWQAKRRPHRFRVQFSDADCGVAYQAAVAAGTDPKEAECCNPLCYRVTEVVCPYGDGEDKIDCALWEECSCVHPDDDPQFEQAAMFRYHFDLSKEIGDPDRYVRVWDEGSTPQGIALALSYELALGAYEDKHEGNTGYEPASPPQCWAKIAPDVDEALEEGLDGLGGLRVGWFDAYVTGEGDLSDSYMVLEVVPEHAEGCVA